MGLASDVKAGLSQPEVPPTSAGIAMAIAPAPASKDKKIKNGRARLGKDARGALPQSNRSPNTGLGKARKVSAAKGVPSQSEAPRNLTGLEKAVSAVPTSKAEGVSSAGQVVGSQGVPMP